MKKEKKKKLKLIVFQFSLLSQILNKKKKIPKRFFKICLEIFRTFQKNP